MYLERFGLRERPFSHAPDARFVYLGERHERALAHLQQSIQVPGGVTYLIGAGGLGKTTLCRLLLSRLPERVDVALIPDPAPTRQELLSVVSNQLGIAHGMDTPSLILGESLFRRQAAGLAARRTAVIVDEAQSLDLDGLEQLDLLSSLEIDGQKLLAIVLVGEPWLLDLLARAGTRRPSPPTGYHLRPFSENETFAYVRHRVTIAGGRPDLFDVGALRDVHRLSSGVPGAINSICAQALLHAVARRGRRVDRSTVRAAARSAHAPAGSPTLEEFDDAPAIDPAATARRLARSPAARSPAARSTRPRWPWLVAGGLVLNALAIGAALLPPRGPNDASPPSETRVAAEPAPPNDTPPPRTNMPADEGARDARRPEPAESIAPAVPTVRPVAPPPARRAAPVTSIAGEPSAPPEETARQRRRRERAELRSATASSAPASDTAPPHSPEQSPLQPSSLKIDMLVWSTEPRQRMVYVNGRKYVEGQTLESGAVLERIEPDGIVLVQEGRRFRLRSEAR
jgi:type II secretory pathway predicted ATPase ExeA